MEDAYSMSEAVRKERETTNKMIYEKNFTTEIFAQNYITFYKNLFEEQR